MSVPRTASCSEILATQVNVFSARAPSKQFLPERALGAIVVVLGANSPFARDLVGDPELASGSRQTLTCRTPALNHI